MKINFRVNNEGGGTYAQFQQSQNQENLCGNSCIDSCVFHGDFRIPLGICVNHVNIWQKIRLYLFIIYRNRRVMSTKFVLCVP